MKMKDKKDSNRKRSGSDIMRKNTKKVLLICGIAVIVILPTVFNLIFKSADELGTLDMIISIFIDTISIITPIIISIMHFFINSLFREIYEKKKTEERRIIGKQENMEEKRKRKKPYEIYRIDIIEKFSKAQFRKNITALLSVTFCLMIWLCLRIFLGVELNRMIPVVLMILAWLIVIHQILLAYRIKKQYYGTNYEEIKELLYFMKYSKEDGPRGGKYVFNDEPQDLPAPGILTEYE